MARRRMKRIRPEDEQLKPCPFCGGEARLQFGWPNQQKKDVRVAFVQCHKCRAKTETTVQQPFMAWEDCKRYAIEKWNRRECEEEPERITIAKEKILQNIKELEENGKHHADFVQRNARLVVEGLRMALDFMKEGEEYD